ncbi:MAG TPA: DUF177 domain-containing protein [Melioribacteraceae bacterium]|nr:DUF177 domain-containing protein [Melioribacteraceae bacterium]
MIIKYTNFSDGIHKLEFDEPVEKVGLENLFFGNVLVDCRMDKSQHQIVLNCEATVNSRFLCDRCNSEYESKINTVFQLSYIFSKSIQQSDDFNVKYLSPEQDKIDISKDVYEYTEIAIPMKKLCSEECKGLCPVCGKNLNLKKCNCHIEINNDIWEPLKKLKSNN